MAKTEVRKYRVLKRSHINGSLHHPGDIVDIKVDPETWHHGDNLEEHKEEPKPAAKSE